MSLYLADCCGSELLQFDLEMENGLPKVVCLRPEASVKVGDYLLALRHKDEELTLATHSLEDISVMRNLCSQRAGTFELIMWRGPRVEIPAMVAGAYDLTGAKRSAHMRTGKLRGTPTAALLQLQEELLRGVGSLIDPVSAVMLFSRTCKALRTISRVPLHLIPSRADLIRHRSPVSYDFASVRTLFDGSDQRFAVQSIHFRSITREGVGQVANCVSLRSLSLHNTKLLLLQDSASTPRGLHVLKSRQVAYGNMAVWQQSLDDLAGSALLGQIHNLDLSLCHSISHLGALSSRTPKLQTLTLNLCSGLLAEGLAPLAFCHALQRLFMNSCTKVSTVASLASVKSLVELDISACRRISDLTPLGGCPQLAVLYAGGLPLLGEIQGLASCALHLIDCSHCMSLHDIGGLSSCEGLVTVKMLGTYPDREIFDTLCSCSSLRTVNVEEGRSIKPTTIQALEANGVTIVLASNMQEVASDSDADEGCGVSHSFLASQYSPSQIMRWPSYEL